MKITRPLLTALLLAPILALGADESLRSAQQELKAQGFYYGEITGEKSNETTAAIKRYQIRNGLEVTGALNKETMDSLQIGGGGSAPAPRESDAPPALEPPSPKSPPPPVVRSNREAPPTHLRRDPDTTESDREFLRQQRPPANSRQPGLDDDDDGDRVPPRRDAAPGGSAYGRTFSRTPYASAPLVVQQDTIRKAQKFLRDLGYYHDSVDGVPGPKLEEGVLGYQRFIGLSLTGRLDMETLSAMRLLPGRGGAPARSSGSSVRKPVRGVWIE